MNTGEMLLRTIITDPGDDTARLVYADWLQENGQGPAAEFIRVQCAGGVASVPLSWLVPLEPFLGRMAHETNRGAESGRAVARTVARTVAREVVFRRGFVEEVTCRAVDWLEHGPAVAARHPVTAVTLSDRVPVWAPAASVAFSPRGGADASLQASGGTVYWWQRGRWNLCPYGLWDELFDCLPSGSGISRNLQDAATDLSTAAVLWARKRAGLPPL